MSSKISLCRTCKMDHSFHVVFRLSFIFTFNENNSFEYMSALSLT